MNIQEYISSGILELYLLGALEEEERTEVEHMGIKHPEVKEELVRIEAALLEYGEAWSPPPSPQVKEEIWQKLGISKGSETEVPTMGKDSFGKRQLISYLLAASVALLIFSNFVTYYYYNKYQQVKDNLIALQSRNDALAFDVESAKETMATTVAAVRDSLANADQQLSLLRNPEYFAVQLMGTERKEQNHVKVFWNKKSNEVYVTAADLPEPPSGMVYQLWALQKSVPVDAGVIDFGEASDRVARMKNISSADAFAITLENQGGSPVPTLTRMYAIGKLNL